MKNISINDIDLLSLTPPFLHFINAKEGIVDNYIQNYKYRNNHSKDIEMRIIRGERCENIDSLFKEWAAALQFPYYFGHNWDAFDECMSDLDWIPAKRYNFFITNSDQLLIEEENREKLFSILIDILSSAAKEWSKEIPKGKSFSRPSISFHIVFQSKDEEAVLKKIQ